eukprot:TRINITY_DN1667_c0_g2_i1.p1 TRINITY_DN1667_c0_g2~~TRINITY_DN1667_c0_g2_i1.p1  ORF type:complete len:656 (-),score=65.85 TRINITY_DN1667_c0_g2_i1:33-2000(-)
MGSVLSSLRVVPDALKTQRTLGVGAIVLISIFTYTQYNKKITRDQNQIKESTRKNTYAVNYQFFQRLNKLLKVCIPGFFTPETGYLILVAIIMVARTYCDVWMLKNGSAIERSIITRDKASFFLYLGKFFVAMVPIACINNILKYGLSELHLRFRTRLTTHLYKKYLQGYTYYQVSNLDNRIANADQLLTQDVDKFCACLSNLYSNVSKPILDIIIYARKLSGSLGVIVPSSMLGYLIISGLFLTKIRRPLGRLTANEQRLEGEFRHVNARLITNSEEIAFYQGNEKEQSVISNSFKRLVNHLRHSMQLGFLIGVVDSMVNKYIGYSVGYFLVSRPFLDLTTPRFLNVSNSELMEEYYRSGRMLLNLSMAVGRLVLAGRELSRLAGFTARVTELTDVLDDLNYGKYKRTMVQDRGSDSDDPPLIPNSGKIIEKERIIKFDKVPLVTPNGDVLVKSLSFEVHSGMNVLVCGPNGCGKSSLFRILGQLWPLFGGELTKPPRDKLFYIPQRPYLTLGTLRDQVIYPHRKEDMDEHLTDTHLYNFLKEVHLESLLDRDGGWDAVQDWTDVLSGGEKQRIAMARLFYHRPQFAILDECTSAVSVDVEGFMYTRCKELGITLFTVSHRKSLWVYHEYVLAFDGKGNYSFSLRKDHSEEFGS